ncbi:restriction endonuclease subunit S [Brachyspira sp. G79]|uniref:restriction endonuclease subunit S n=1 Tax=Brachyspira sp. G79 TaxID=1358104 RepID=UPI000BBCA3EA|nr:restriction endonuclease subunit S [Brachyspira sp. G79]PCG19223.1 hypothetical protein KQ44_03570 [Brachyspira sp. G79]
MKKNQKEWQEVRLGDIVYFNPTEKLIKGNNYKKISMDCLIPKTRKIENYEINIFNGGSKFRNGDTLMARITPCLENGKTAQVSILEENEIAFGSTEFIVLREKENISDNNFIYYLFNTDYIRNIAIKSMTGTSGRQRVQEDVLKNLIIKLPPLEEQKKIASILSSLDDKIELNNRMNKILEDMAQTIFKEWFVNFNFPNEEGKPYKDSGGKMIESELGNIPEGWKVGIIKDISKEVICGKTPPTKDEENYGDYMPFITIPDMHNNTFIIKSERYLSNKGVNTQINKTVPENSICVSCIATVGLVSLTSENSQTNQQINTIIPKKDISSYWVYFYMKNISNIIINYASGGTTTLNLNKSLFEKINIIIPEISILVTFNNNIKSIFDMIKSNQIENQKLASIRDTLLPRLMSGEIRVK